MPAALLGLATPYCSNSLRSSSVILSSVLFGAFLYVPPSTVAGVVSLYVLPSSATDVLPPPPDVRKYAPPAMTTSATTTTPMIRPVFFFGGAGGIGTWPP